MQPIFGFLIYAAAVWIVGIVASKRGLTWWAYVLGCILAAPLFVLVIAQAGASSMGAGFGVFVVPLVAFVIALASNTSEREAVVTGKSADYKKCPFCAEAVRMEAIKCKHCGSSLEALA